MFPRNKLPRLATNISGLVATNWPAGEENLPYNECLLAKYLMQLPSLPRGTWSIISSDDLELEAA